MDATTVEVTNLAKANNENDPTKQLISFKREEMEKFREHELKSFQLMLSQRENNRYDTNQATPSSWRIPFGETGHYPNWNRGFGTGPPCQLRMPDGSYGTALPAIDIKY